MFYLQQHADAVEEAGDEEEGNEYFQQQEPSHGKGRENSHKTVHKTRVKTVHTRQVTDAEKCENDEKKLKKMR